MRTEMKMPQMGESIAEATILKWLKAVGDTVQKDETILEISTDKVDSEIPAPASGKIVEILAQEGQTVAVKSVIAIIGAEGDAAAPAEKPSSPAQKSTAPSAKVEPAKPAPVAAEPAQDVPAQVGDRFYSPLVRSLASQHNLSAAELAGISGSGTNGRVTKEDVLLYLDNRNAQPKAAAQSQSRPAQARAESPAPAAARPQFDSEGIRVEPMDNMRRLIAEHMVRSKATSPHVYSMAEVDMTAISKWRKKHQDTFVSREGFKLSFTPFFLEAAVRALMQFPRVNASVDGDNVILKRDINLGCAVALGNAGLDGLIVPVIKNAGDLNLSGIARALNDLANRARTKKLKPDDVQGGTFTVTNPGIFGNIMGCPIINQPQAANLALGAIKKRPVVVDDAIAIREIVILTLSYDHRIIDGALAGHFLSYVTNYLENWDMDRAL